MRARYLGLLLLHPLDGEIIGHCFLSPRSVAGMCGTPHYWYETDGPFHPFVMSLLSCSHGRCCCCLYPRLRPSVRPLPCFIASISDDDRAYQNDTTTTTVHMDLLSEITSNDDDDQHALRFILPPFSEANDRLHLFTCAFFFSSFFPPPPPFQSARWRMAAAHCLSCRNSNHALSVTLRAPSFAWSGCLFVILSLALNVYTQHADETTAAAGGTRVAYLHITCITQLVCDDDDGRDVDGDESSQRQTDPPNISLLIYTYGTAMWTIEKNKTKDNFPHFWVCLLSWWVLRQWWRATPTIFFYLWLDIWV